MGACNDFIKKLRKELPELCDIPTLIKCGFFKSYQQAYGMRIREDGPEFFKIAGMYKYPKESILTYLRNHSGGHDEI
jgi:hypothetical protein